MTLKGIEKLSDQALDNLLKEKKDSKNTTFTRLMDNRTISLWFNHWEFFAYSKINEKTANDLLKLFPEWQADIKNSWGIGYQKALSYGKVPQGVISKGDWEEKNTQWIEMSYFVHETLPLEIDEEQRTPKILHSANELYTLIQWKNFIFYTGAGISIQQVPWMDELKNSLGIDGEKPIDELLQLLYSQPTTIEDRWLKFFDKMDNTSPSVAHRAIADIAYKQNYKVMTENLDLLHQKTHIVPEIPSTEFFEKDSIEDIESLDYIITIWLSHDDRWMLAYCKKINPQLRIISINPKIAEYISKDDYQLSDDCQKILPELSKLIETE